MPGSPDNERRPDPNLLVVPHRLNRTGTNLTRRLNVVLTYWSLIAGILRAGCRAFPISTRNSEAAVAHLLRILLQQLRRKSGAPLYVPSDAVRHASQVPQRIPNSSTCRILMESGLIHDTVYAIGMLSVLDKFALTTDADHGQVDVCGDVLTLHPVPMFYVMGVLPMSWTVFAGLTVAVFPTMLPPMVPTSASVFAGAVATDSTLMYCVPAFLEVGSILNGNVLSDSALIELGLRARLCGCSQEVQGCDLLGGGGRCSGVWTEAPAARLTLSTATVGDMLAENGVKLAHVYGQRILLESPPTEGWEYFLISPHVDLAFMPVEGSGHALTCKKWVTHTPAKAIRFLRVEVKSITFFKYKLLNSTEFH
ncbi:hypothetical protein GGX14DRAFT_407426 [Mycena pura]|uniref:Uncharacterized protein n=1 Tax=Mycena pura TaxID=153505 RepID=A0AAD6Y289_9AGAR|nr:hypothetical protein GGX14DRAFT_407426 [Mycena pura]